MIQGCCHLLDGLLQISDLSSNTEILAGELERLFIYSLTWAVGGLLDVDDRVKFSNYMSQSATTPPVPVTNERSVVSQRKTSLSKKTGKGEKPDLAATIPQVLPPVSARSPVSARAADMRIEMPVMQKQGDTLFEYTVNTDSMEWERWVAPQWEYPSSIEDPDFSSMLVPTMETTRASYILSQLHKQRLSVLMTGSSGTAKTSTALLSFETIIGDNIFDFF
jgi:dynein heavy chain